MTKDVLNKINEFRKIYEVKCVERYNKEVTTPTTKVVGFLG